MKINELQIRQGKVELTAQVSEKGEVREFEKFGKTGKVCNAKLTDDTGSVSLTLWNEQVDQVKVGDTVKIENGYVGEYQGEKQLTTGKFGSLEIVSAEQSTDEPASEEAPAEAEQKAPEPQVDQTSEPDEPERVEDEEIVE